MMHPSISLRALAAGLFIGLLINLSNTYYGLRVNVANQMPMVSTLFGFISVRLFSRYLTAPITPDEKVLLLSVSTAVECMPVTAGLVGIIPALEYLVTPDEGGPLRLSLGSLMLWSAGLCFFGLIFAVLLHQQLVIGEKLPWPGARATAQLIRTLHDEPAKPEPGCALSAEADPTESPADQHDTDAIPGEQESPPWTQLGRHVKRTEISLVDQ
ncbi:OPT oligopeptide transporter protein-domain-containing protein [Immersiella caudata]|uniref:OPT oligopeptide transporter protein-domain-containing protein n=1 Tax=Immersiella caudata TaxID=314043 RepID=A0AA39X506_9PEZI|nr:OPT oligopeptide transporter protein-domain-containing protein [Immersiella caudata]